MYEEYCRKILQKIYGLEFPSCRPSFLVNPETGKELELDGYNEELEIAFEYNGEQHYNYPNVFHKTEHEFIEQVRRDIFKRKICDKRGIYLIVIPYTVSKETLYDFIVSRLPENYVEQSD
jgi:hypothetical protein